MTHPLQRLIRRRRDRTSSVRLRRHRRDATCVASERAQLAPAAQIPHLQRVHGELLNWAN